MIFELNEEKILSGPQGSYIVEGEDGFDSIVVKLPEAIDGNTAANLKYEMHLVNAKGGYILLPLTVDNSAENAVATAKITSGITYKPQVFYPYIVMTDDQNTLIGKTNFVTLRVYPVPNETDEIITPEQYEERIQELEEEIDRLEDIIEENTAAMNRINGFSDGEDGKSAYEIAVDNGFVGTPAEWLASLKGEPGTTDYPELSNKPQINGVTLSGNKTDSDLGIQKKITIPTPSSAAYDQNTYLVLRNNGELNFNSQFVFSLQPKLPKNDYWSTISGFSDVTLSLIQQEGLTIGADKNIPVNEAGFYCRFSSGTYHKEFYRTNSGVTYQKITLLQGGGWVSENWIATQSVQVVSAVVNQNGTITFTNSDGSTFTTTGSNIVTSGNEQISVGYDNGGFYFLFDDGQEGE